MKKLTTDEIVAENENVLLLPDLDILEKTTERVLLPDLDSKRTYKLMSPRLANPDQIKDFAKEIIEETRDAAS
jgi:hypothetical protein